MYAHHIGESNRHGNFLDPIRMTNLCVEITNPHARSIISRNCINKEQLDQMKPEDIGEVSLCNLGVLYLGAWNLWLSGKNLLYSFEIR